MLHRTRVDDGDGHRHVTQCGKPNHQ
jgi:hypothetical protein